MPRARVGAAFATPAFGLAVVTPFFEGYRIVAERHFHKPRPERDTFSGGRNLSAMARNAKRLAEAKKVFVMHAPPTIIVPAWYVDEFVAELRDRIPTNLMPGGWL